MSYIDALKQGEIPFKSKNRVIPLTPYDKHIELKTDLLSSRNNKSVSVIKICKFIEIKACIDSLKNGVGLIIELCTKTIESSQRILDYLSGAVYAIDGTIYKIKEKTYLITPKNIDIRIEK